MRGERRKDGSDLYFCSVQACVIPCGRGEVRYEGPGVRTLAVPIKETKVLFVSTFLVPFGLLKLD